MYEFEQFKEMYRCTRNYVMLLESGHDEVSIFGGLEKGSGMSCVYSAYEVYLEMVKEHKPKVQPYQCVKVPDNVKVGTLVKCIDASGCDKLVVGGTYIVRAVTYGTHIQLVCKLGTMFTGDYLWKRFEVMNRSVG